MNAELSALELGMGSTQLVVGNFVEPVGLRIVAICLEIDAVRFLKDILVSTENDDRKRIDLPVQACTACPEEHPDQQHRLSLDP